MAFWAKFLVSVWKTWLVAAFGALVDEDEIVVSFERSVDHNPSVDYTVADVHSEGVTAVDELVWVDPFPFHNLAGTVDRLNIAVRLF
jgi:hypothetical protein